MEGRATKTKRARGRPKLPPELRARKITLSVNIHTYENYRKLKKMGINVSAIFSSFLTLFVSRGLQVVPYKRASHAGDPGSNPGGRILHTPSEFVVWLRKQNFSKNYLRDLISATKIMNFNTYENSWIKNKTHLRLYQNFLKFLVELGQLTEEQAQQLRKKAPKFSSHPDLFVPNAAKIKTSLKLLQPKYQPLYLGLLYSGLRGTEFRYVLKNKQLKAVEFAKGYVRIELNLKKGTKNAFYCYLPKELYDKLRRTRAGWGGFIKNIKKTKAIPPKYLRKYFFTTALKTGVPEAVANYYQGRADSSVGARHYLAKAQLADQFYPNLVRAIRLILDTKTQESTASCEKDSKQRV